MFSYIQPFIKLMRISDWRTGNPKTTDKKKKNIEKGNKEGAGI